MLDFRILGPLEVWDDGRPIPLRGGRQRGLLALLLLNANQVVSSDRLLDELWGDDQPAARGTALRVRVSQLRKALGSEGRRIVTQAPGYVLRLERHQLDLARFEDLVADSGGSDLASSASSLRDALALWRGPPLADFEYESFAQAAIGRLDELRLAVVERRVDADLALGRHSELVGELEGLVAEHPLRERFAAQLMLALYRAGRAADALDVYSRTRRMLVDELGIEPGTALQELERAILRQEPELAAPPQPSADRSILVAPLDRRRFGALLAVAEPLARHSRRELILAQLIGSAAVLATATATSRELREGLRTRGVAARAAAFTTSRPGADLVRIASEQDVDLMLLEAPDRLLEDLELQTVLADAPCDVAALVVREAAPTVGPLLVPFTGAEHDWSAIELGAWIAQSQDCALLLAGPVERERDASRLLASASLAVQRSLGVQAEPLLVDPGVDGLLAAAEGAELVVVGLSDRWAKEGLGEVRLALATRASPPVLVVRRGLRPGGLAPAASATRFTWSIAVSTS
jgi:DNA-binding SARP family transcriptional activator